MANKERVALWVERLGDPTLVQGHGLLAKRESEDDPWQQCCLDIACEIAVENGVPLKTVVQEAQFSEQGMYKRGYTGADVNMDLLPMNERMFHVNWTNLPRSVMEWYGFNSPDVIVHFEGDTHSAIALNDDFQLPFTKIAEAIAATYLTDEEEPR